MSLSPTTTPSPDRTQLLNDMRWTAAACGELSEILAVHANKQHRLKRLLRSLNFLVGVAVVLVSLLSLSPAFTALAGAKPVSIAAIVGAAFLLADAALPSLLQEPNPDRFRDYAKYIRDYTQDLMELINDTDTPYEAWKARAHALIKLARKNIDDTELQWPSFHREMVKRDYPSYWKPDVARPSLPPTA